MLITGMALVVSACEKKPVQKADEVPAEKPLPQATRRPDIAREYPMRAGARPEVAPETARASATRVQTVGGTTYVAFPHAGASQHWLMRRLTVEGGALTLCTASQGSAEFVARFKRAPEAFTATWYDVNGYGSEVTQARRGIEVEVAGAKKDEGLEAEFYGCASQRFANHWGNGAGSYYRYASSRLGALAKGEAEQGRAEVNTWAQRPGEFAQTMDLYTGMTSIEEALQTDRGLRVRKGEEKRDVALSTIRAVEVEAHPWGEMINELGRESVHAPLADIVPFDMAYVHFHDVRDFVRTARRLEEVVLPAAAALEGGDGTSDVAGRYERELVMRRTAVSEAMGDVAIKSFALVASDPFLREGADVSLLFEVANQAALEATLAGFVASAKSERSDLSESSYEVGGQKVTVWSTPDGVHNRHMVEVNGVLVLSNSRVAVSRIVETAAGKRDALPSRGDFQYMRALYPFDEKSEDGFVFIGDDFVREAISPRAKILSSRRVRAAADLGAVNSAALLHGWLEGAPPKTLEEMVASGALAPGLTTTFEGEPITWSPAQGASTPKWGRLGQLTPLADLQVQQATKQEAEAYKQFEEGYQQYWRQFIDPIGATLKWSESGDLDMEARMLPLIESSAYDELIGMVGRKRFVLERPPVAGASFFYGLGQDARLRRDLSEIVREISPEGVSIDWAGEWVGFGFGDRSGLWDAAMYGGGIPSLQDRRSGGGWDELFYFAARLPLWAMVQVEDEDTLRKALDQISKELTREVGGQLTWSSGEPYREAATHALTFNGDSSLANAPYALDLHYAIAGGVWVLALERALLEERIDDVLDGRVPVPSATPVGALPNLTDRAMQSTLTVVPWPEDSHMVDTLSGFMEWGSIEGMVASADLLHVLTGGLGAQALSGEGAARMAMRYFGRVPYAPHGQALVVGADGSVTHPRYGNAWSPDVLDVPVEGSPVSRLLSVMAGLEMSLGFDAQGKHKGLHTRLRWRAR